MRLRWCFMMDRVAIYLDHECDPTVDKEKVRFKAPVRLTATHKNR